MKLVNKTDWHTTDLKAIARAALRAAGAGKSWQPITVRIEPPTGKRGIPYAVHGFAWYGTPSNPNNFVLRIPPLDRAMRRDGSPASREELLVEVCRVAHHEALHAVGAKHKDMTDEQRYCTQAVPWAAELKLRTKAEVLPKLERAPDALRAAAFDDKLAHVRSMHAKAVTRRKRAETIEKKWTRRLRALERKI